MEELVNLLEKYFSKDTKYHNFDTLKKDLKIKGENSLELLKAALKQLEIDGVIFFDKKYGYRKFPSKSGFAFGEIEITKYGVGYVHTSDGYTIMVENGDLGGALNNDTVIVTNIFNKGKDFYHGEVYKIVKRNNGNIIFEVIRNGFYVSLVPYNKYESINIEIDKNELKDLIDGELVLVKVGCKSINGAFEATIDKVIGYKDDPNIDIKLIFEKFNIPVDFSDEVINEAKKIPQIVSDEDIKNRVDLRKENVFTIDCDNTKDRDDAVSIMKLQNGNYLLKVSIAHVSHYINKDSKLFLEAKNRCSSHYPGNTCVPMFPHILSNGICSLNQNVDRLTRTVEMEIDNLGNVINYDIYNSVINSKMAMSYSNVNKVLNGEYLSAYEPYRDDLMLMKELNQILEDARNRRNYINFNTSEVQVIEHENYYEFKPNNLGLAGQIIENFMLVANTTVYNHYSWFTLCYRIHESPSEERVKEVLDILRESNIRIPKINNIDSKSLKTLIDELGDNETSLIVRELLLKSMKKARYDINNIGHFALQYDTYGHFTSPIRRIVDLVTHMTIDNIDNFDYSEDSIKQLENNLKEICDKSNNIELVDREIEEEVLDMLMAEHMENHVGEEYEANIIDIGNTYILVRTSDLIKGKINLSDLPEDYYYYDYDKKAIVGKNTKKKYQIGNKLRVIVKEASKKTRIINFEIPKVKKLQK